MFDHHSYAHNCLSCVHNCDDQSCLRMFLRSTNIWSFVYSFVKSNRKWVSSQCWNSTLKFRMVQCNPKWCCFLRNMSVKCQIVQCRHTEQCSFLRNRSVKCWMVQRKHKQCSFSRNKSVKWCNVNPSGVAFHEIDQSNVEWYSVNTIGLAWCQVSKPPKMQTWNGIAKTQLGQQSVNWVSGHYDVSIVKFGTKLCRELCPVFALSPPSCS